ncbi:hypothetical protein PAAG_01487 [Paracoccidioides lutzii Pb01]|uniref:Uncharacterized protein n=1 Tax=Paracoccidioides lutzii (strain ATCC MYA-826 / Pb01) TaxID=502779 RepID=C1GSJ2_PARBA|nr:hypothetical protein PAAG_01487 [Paracoccidioides lutzii Pb01]EEH39025.2 hypothetical protein PAAG_01487 [Paracoccidioides lutzii Pb01]
MLLHTDILHLPDSQQEIEESKDSRVDLLHINSPSNKIGARPFQQQGSILTNETHPPYIPRNFLTASKDKTPYVNRPALMPGPSVAG